MSCQENKTGVEDWLTPLIISVSLNTSSLFLIDRLSRLEFSNAIGGREIYARLYKIALYPPPSPFKIRRRERHTQTAGCVWSCSLFFVTLRKKQREREKGQILAGNFSVCSSIPPPSGERTHFSLSSLPLSV